MHRGSQFLKLLHPRCALVELHQRRVDRRHVLRRIRTAKTAEPRIGRRRGAHRQQMQNPATQPLHDVRQLPRHIPQLPRGRNHRVAQPVQLVHLRLPRRVSRRNERPRLAKHPGKRAVNRVRRAIKIGMNAHAKIIPGRPMLKPLRIQRIRLGLEPAHLRQRQGELPLSVHPAHRDVPPGRPGQRHLVKFRLDDLLPDHRRPAQIGAQPGRPARRRPLPRMRMRQREDQVIPDELDAPFPRARCHVWPFHRARECGRVPPNSRNRFDHARR